MSAEKGSAEKEWDGTAEYQQPAFEERALPPVVLMLVVIIGLMIWTVLTRRKNNSTIWTSAQCDVSTDFLGTGEGKLAVLSHQFPEGIQETGQTPAADKHTPGSLSSPPNVYEAGRNIVPTPGPAVAGAKTTDSKDKNLPRPTSGCGNDEHNKLAVEDLKHGPTGMQKTDTKSNANLIPPLFCLPDLQILRALDQGGWSDIRESVAILLPMMICLGLSPVLIFSHTPIVRLFWPADRFPRSPNVNDAISCYLVPAAMVYAVSFGFVFQQVASRFTEIEVVKLKKVLNIVLDLRCVPPTKRVEMARVVKVVTLETIARLLGRHDDFKKSNVLPYTGLHDVVRLAYKNAMVKDEDIWQSALLRRLEELVDSHTGSYVRMFLKPRIHPLQWFVLETLGYFTFAGIMLVFCDSYRAEIAMCYITVISISILCYLVADFDSPFYGFFRIDLQQYNELISLLVHVFNASVRDVKYGDKLSTSLFRVTP
ncbi:hypothetical protein BaRGS_00035647 [Batillaria attramentaria]|uniref:Odorant receptor n=1 Tax=Batillaria attramentaria TaxID=370345 RepID=A0ABD0JE23_9CAEN